MALDSSQVIVLATPVFLAMIGAELVIGIARGRNTYRLADAMASISAGMVSEISKVFVRLFAIGMYGVVFKSLALWQLPADAWWVWLLALVGYDFCYYWYHRFGHRVAVGWAAHAVHHQSEDYNLSTALRQTSSGFFFGWIFYLPLAVLGVPPKVFAIVALVDLLYQYWVHTQQVGKLGWFDRWFCSPSNHRVHHAVNDRYLDKNYGGILIVWDRMFGSFAEEDDAERCVYGTRSPLRSWNPIWSNLQVYRDLVVDSWRAGRFLDKFKVWTMPPGWRPADVAARWPKAPFELAQVQRFDPPLSPARGAAALALFVVALGATTGVLWFARELTLPMLALAAGGAVALLCAVSALCTPYRRAAANAVAA